MQSPENSICSDTEWVEIQNKILTTYSEKIESCIAQSAWEMLAIVMEARHAYLLQLFSPSVSEQYRTFLKQLAALILQQDARVKARVEEQKSIIALQQLSLDRGRRAVRTYSLNN
jgi:hypothetical protein